MLVDDWCSRMEPVDWMRSAAMLLMVTTAGSGSRQTWLKVEVLASLLGGALLQLFPGVLSDFQVSSKLDAGHLLFIRIHGLHMLMFGLITVVNRHSRDPQFWSTLFLAKSLVYMLFAAFGLGAQIRLYNATPGLTTQHLTFSVLASVLFACGHLYQFYRLDTTPGRSSGTKEDHARLNMHLLILTIILTIFLVFNLIYTADAMREVVGESVKVDAIHLHLMRMSGGATLLFYIIILTGFLNVTDISVKKNILLLIIALTVGAEVLMAYHHFAYGLFREGFFKKVAVFHGVTILNSVLGYFHEHIHLKK